MSAQSLPRETMTMKAKESELRAITAENDERQEKELCRIIRRVYGRGMIFWDSRRTRTSMATRNER